MKNKYLIIMILAAIAPDLNAQQWSGNNNQTDDISRSGNVSINRTSWGVAQFAIVNYGENPGNWSSYWQGGGNIDSQTRILLLNPNAGTGFTNGLYLGLDQAFAVKSYTIGTKDATPLSFYTSGVERFRIGSNGNVGVGVTDPSGLLHLHSSASVLKMTYPENGYAAIRGLYDTWIFGFGGISGSEDISIGTQDGSGNRTLTLAAGGHARMKIASNGDIGIGTNPQTKLHVSTLSYVSDQVFDPTSNLLIENTSTAWRTSTAIRFQNFKGAFTMGMYGLNDTNSNSFRIYNGSNPNFVIDQIGRIGIGITNPTAKLEVDGTIISEEIKVQVVNGPDYVFSPDYELRTLEETKTFIEENQHLPEIPSAGEMETNGIALGEMNMLLLKKIEELTLYVLEQNEILKEQTEQIKKVELQNQQLENRLKTYLND